MNQGLKGMALTAALLTTSAYSGELKLTCDGSEGYPYDETTAAKASYTLWLSADRKSASMRGIAEQEYKFPIFALNDDLYADEVTTIGPGKPDLEFWIDRRTLQVWYNRGFASGKRMIFSGHCKLKPPPKI